MLVLTLVIFIGLLPLHGMFIMSRLSNKKFNSKALIITMSWAEIIYFVWFQRNVKIFRGMNMDEKQIGQVVIFNVAARLPDKLKYVLII